MTASGEVASFVSAAESFAQLVRQIPSDRWDGPGMGAWNLRSLVGHTSIAVSTVSAYLGVPADREDVASAAEYYALVHQFASNPEVAVRNEERGRRAGTELGDDPAAAVHDLAERAVSDLADVEDKLIGVTGGVGMRLWNYLPTRTFELAVHGFDIAQAAGIIYALPYDVLAEMTALAAHIAVVTGQAETVLLSLTGRTALPPSFSVL
jgi:Mycothiol maleylpyruvate isomerase N-terminal domain